jgi:hypothetical protein
VSPALLAGQVRSFPRRCAVLVGGVVQSPVLVGRDDFLTLAADRLAEVAAGAGKLLFIAGEAGIGKTRLLGSIERQARRGNCAVVRAAAFPGDAASYAGLLLDLASDLMPAEDPALSDLGLELSSRVRAISAYATVTRSTRRFYWVIGSGRPAGLGGLDAADDDPRRPTGPTS